MRKVLFLLFIVFIFMGCRTKYIPVETIITNTEYKTRVDSFISKDTLFNEKETIIREINASDSLLLKKMGLQLQDNQRLILVLQKELEKEKNNKAEIRCDTLIEVDSISVPYPVEKALTKWQKIKMTAGEIGLIAFGVIILLLILGFIFKGKFK